MKKITQECRPSKKVEDQKAGPIDGAGTWQVRQDAAGMAYTISTKAFDLEENLLYPYIPTLH